jgi:hypothetical protein
MVRMGPDAVQTFPMACREGTIMTESGLRSLVARLRRSSPVLVLAGACALAGAGALSAAGPSSVGKSPAGGVEASPELSAAMTRTHAAIALEKRALRLLAAYDAHHKNGGTAGDRKITERSVVGWLRASVNDLNVASGNVAKYGDTQSATAEPISTELESAVKHDMAAVGELLNFSGHHNFARERAGIEAALAAKSRAVALLTTAIAAPPPTLYMVGVAGTWNHVQPGVFSHFCLTVDTGGAPAGSHVKVRLTGPGVQGSSDADLTTDASGFAYMTWTITKLGQYVASATLTLADGYTQSSNGSVEVTSAAGDPASCK